MNRDSTPPANGDIERLLNIMLRLRDPERGCPWDLEQDFSTIAPYTIEEAYEVADAIENGGPEALRDELGDLLFQVVFHARMADEAGWFDFADVVRAVSDKMVRRHPHVFPDEAGNDRSIDSAAAQKQAWEETKAAERAARGEHGVLDDVPRGLAELQRAEKLQKRAARVGFDWSDPEPVVAKIAEELDEVRAALADGDAEAVERELGDLVFAAINLARQVGADAARGLRGTNSRFERRFRVIEAAAGSREVLVAMSLEEMEALWQRAKQEQADG